MAGITTIQFTHDQMRTLTDVSAETMRHWRKTIPYLSSKTGKAARFSFTDLVGLAVTNELVNSFGVHIATVSNGVDALFGLLASSSPALLDGAVALITPTKALLHETGSDGLGRMPATPALVIPLGPFVAKIQQHMLPAIPVSMQSVLPFALKAVRSHA